LAAMLDRVAKSWSLDDAEAWWSRHERGQQSAAAPVIRPTKGNGNGVSSAPPKPLEPKSPAAPQAMNKTASGFDRTMIFDSPDDGTK